MANDPYRGYKFEVEIAGFNRAGFSKISGLKQTTEAIDYREGGDNETPRKIPGQTTFDDITLERGLSKDEDFIKWMSEIFDIDRVDGHQGDEETFRRDITIYLKNKAGRRVKRWKVSRAWPKERSYGDLDANGNDILIETLIVCNEGVSGPDSL